MQINFEATELKKAKKYVQREGSFKLEEFDIFLELLKEKLK